jgi:hypothetical protein
MRMPHPISLARAYSKGPARFGARAACITACLTVIGRMPAAFIRAGVANARAQVAEVTHELRISRERF